MPPTSPSLSTGATPDLDPVFRSAATNGSNRAPAFALALDGDALLIGAGGSGGGCTLQDAVTGANRWSYHTTGNVVAAAFLGPRAYCAGHFNGSASFASFSRKKIAEVTTSTGAVTSFAPSVNSALGIFALAATPTALLAGGDFTKVGSTSQPYMGMFVDKAALTPPAGVENLLARPGDHQVALRWDPPGTDGGLEDHELQDLPGQGFGQARHCWPRRRASATSTPPRSTARRVTPASTYTYYVQPVNKAGVRPEVGHRAGGARGGPGHRAASAPQDFVAQGILGRRVARLVAAGDGGRQPGHGIRHLAGHRVRQAGAADDRPGTTRGYVDSDVVVGTRYYYTVAAVNAAGTGIASKEASATPNTGVPGAPSLTATPGPPRVLLEWVPSPIVGASPVTKYILVRDGVRVASASATTVEYTDSAVVPGRSYEYQVKALNSYGSSKWSDTVVATVG